MANYGEETYNVTKLAQLFHSFPHFNMTFALVNSTFNPYSDVYLESLGILAAIPSLWLILNLIAFLVYFLSRCCQKDWKQKRNLTPIKWTLAILGILCCGGIAVGFYGNNDADVAVHKFADATNSMQKIFESVKMETRTLEDTLKNRLLPQMDVLEKFFEKPMPTPNATVQVALKQAVENMEADVKNGLSSVELINDKIEKIGIYNFPNDVKKVEDFRWPVTLAVLSLFLVLCIVLFLGVLRHSRSILITFSVLAFFVIIINWLLVSIYLVASVAIGDFCIDPESFIRSQLTNKTDKAILDYYLDCHSGSSSPFMNAIKNGEKAIDTVEETMTFVKTTSQMHYPAKDLHPQLQPIIIGINETESLLRNIEALLDCQAMHRQFIVALDSVCGSFLYGLAFLLLSACATGMFFVILEWLTSNTWIYIRKKVYVPVDEQDPFLPPSASSNSYRGRETYGSTAPHRPRHIHTPPQTPPFPSSQPFFCSNGRMPRIEDGPLQGRYTPPPLYEQLTGGLAPTAPLDT